MSLRMSFLLEFEDEFLTCSLRMSFLLEFEDEFLACSLT